MEKRAATPPIDYKPKSMSQGKVLFLGGGEVDNKHNCAHRGGARRRAYYIERPGKKGAAAADHSSIQGGDGSITLTQSAAGDNHNDTAVVACALLHFYGM